MSALLTCPECGGKLKVAEHLAGKKIQCPKCSAIFAVDTALQAADSPKAHPPAQPEAITAEPVVPLLAEEVTPRPVRIRDIPEEEDPTTETVATIIPYRNVLALVAYYCGVFSIIPCVGLVLGPTAFVLGLLGLRYANTHPTAHGTGHAITGIILGSLTSLANWGVVLAGGLAALFG